MLYFSCIECIFKFIEYIYSSNDGPLLCLLHHIWWNYAGIWLNVWPNLSQVLAPPSFVFPLYFHRSIAMTVLVQNNDGSELNFNGWTVQFNSLTLCRDFLAFLGCLFFFQILLNQIILSWFNWFSILYCFCHIIFSVI